MRSLYRDEGRRLNQRENRCAIGENKPRGGIFRTRVNVTADLGWAAACRCLPTFMACVRVPMPLMRGTDPVALMSGARWRRATGRGSGAQTDVIEQERQYRNCRDLDPSAHQNCVVSCPSAKLECSAFRPASQASMCGLRTCHALVASTQKPWSPSTICTLVKPAAVSASVSPLFCCPE